MELKRDTIVRQEFKTFYTDEWNINEYYSSLPNQVLWIICMDSAVLWNFSLHAGDLEMSWPPWDPKTPEHLHVVNYIPGSEISSTFYGQFICLRSL